MTNIDQDQKYFIPDIEELRVGYECQLHRIYYVRADSNTYINYCSEMEKWVDITITSENIHLYTGELKKGLIRVPYLTPDQIKAEGWMDRDYHFLKVKGYYDENEDSTGYEYYLSYYPKSHRLFISCDEINYGKAGIAYEPSNDLFTGYCKDINTLRNILKYINI